MKKVVALVGGLLLMSGVLYAQNEVIKTDKAPVPVGPYSQGVVANGTVYLAGQLGINPATNKLIEGGLEKEFAQIMENIKAILAARGMSLNQVVNTTIFMKDLRQFGKVNELYATYFTGNYPARTTVGVADLPLGATIEVAVIASVTTRTRKK